MNIAIYSYGSFFTAVWLRLPVLGAKIVYCFTQKLLKVLAGVLRLGLNKQKTSADLWREVSTDKNSSG